MRNCVAFRLATLNRFPYRFRFESQSTTIRIIELVLGLWQWPELFRPIDINQTGWTPKLVNLLMREYIEKYIFLFFFTLCLFYRYRSFGSTNYVLIPQHSGRVCRYGRHTTVSIPQRCIHFHVDTIANDTACFDRNWGRPKCPLGRLNYIDSLVQCYAGTQVNLSVEAEKI